MNPDISLQIVGDYVQIIEAIVSTLAVIIGGFFAWRKWFKEAPEEERAIVTHEIDSCLLSKDARLVHVAFTIENKGTSRLLFTEGYTKIFQAKPLHQKIKGLLKMEEEKRPVAVTGTEYDWPNIGEKHYPVLKNEQAAVQDNFHLYHKAKRHEKRKNKVNETGKEEYVLIIESSETEQLCSDFIIPARVKAVMVYSTACLKPKDPDTGWDVTTFLRFSKTQH